MSFSAIPKNVLRISGEHVCLIARLSMSVSTVSKKPNSIVADHGASSFDEPL